MLRARSPLGVFRGRPPFDRQPARLSDRGPPQPAPELCGSRRCLQGLGLSVVGGATPGRDTGKRSEASLRLLKKKTRWAEFFRGAGEAEARLTFGRSARL